MADFPKALRARLKADAGVQAAAGGRVDWVRTAAGSAMPYLLLTTVSDPRPVNFDGDDLLRETWVQVDAWGESYSSTRAAADAAIAALRGAATIEGVRFERTFIDGPEDSGEQQSTRFVYRSRFSAMVWHAAADAPGA